MTGDTSQYFIQAYKWITTGQVDVIWSPLYSIFYGFFLHLTSDAYFATVLHRSAIVLIISILLLTVMRRLFPPFIAWFLTFWWVCLYVNYGALYEVHLFTVIPVLVMLLASLITNSKVLARVLLLSLMLATSLFIRNEFIFSFVFLLMYSIFSEYRSMKLNKISLKFIVTAYLLPFMLVIFVFLFAFVNDPHNVDQMKNMMKSKHTLNMAQVYSFGYHQRHLSFQENPWMHYHKTMKSTFGSESPSFLQMSKNNFKATFDHVLWNIKLLPSGIELLLFDKSSGKFNPGYESYHLNRKSTKALDYLLISILFVGVILILVDYHKWKQWLESNELFLMLMLSMLPVSAIVIITQRPRPEYLYNLSIFIIVIAGLSIWAILSKCKIYKLSKIVSPIVILVIFTIVLSSKLVLGSKPWLDTYRNLKPYGHLIAAEDAHFLSVGYSTEVQSYIRHKKGHTFDYSSLNAYGASGKSLFDILHRNKINIFYINNAARNNIPQEQVDEFFNSYAQNSWIVLAHGGWGDDAWWLFKKNC
ncbi:hypothetical protein N9L02_01930 [Gammaproteobacteria bacterium]|nr:hypothetical protein [Gammaproteobacteria bacterium]